MGSFVELNDTLRISKEQGFPEELEIKTHLEEPYTIESVKGKLFAFHSKDKIRIYQQPPVRNFLVEFIDGKWLYWGACFIHEIHHDYMKGETSGTFEIIGINSPDEMKQMFKLTHYATPERDNYF